MTQPPDDLERRPDGSSPDDSVPPEDQPTIAWTPPGAPSEGPPPAPADGPPPEEAPPPEPPTGDVPAADVPAEAVPPGEVPLTEWTPTQPAPLDVPAPTAPTPSPIIGAAPGREGYVIAGMGARLVAYFIDGLVVSIIPTILTFLVVDYSGLIQESIDAAREGAAAGQTTFTITVTPELILVTLISLALQYLYFVGFWTSGGRATPGMRGLRMQVVDAASGATLSLAAATKRFVALGYPLALLILIPALQNAAGVAQFALSLFLFFTAITNDRRQGLHDKWANSLVIRSTTSGDGAVVIGCLVIIVIVVGFAIALFGTVLAAMGPYLEELIREAEQTT